MLLGVPKKRSKNFVKFLPTHFKKLYLDIQKIMIWLFVKIWAHERYEVIPSKLDSRSCSSEPVVIVVDVEKNSTESQLNTN
jgi:hypothetical protein